ncbi:MAG: hypothetical protein IJA38_03295 [Bacteroidales bacterium]|nr:hypothetical protein [Bacteroidales bacterium]
MKSFYRTIILLLGLTALPLFTGSAQAREKEEFSRGIEMSTFVPKGNWIAGGSFSYSENTASDYEMLIVEDIDGTNYSFKVSPFVGYFFKDNLCIGGRFGYSRSMIKLNSTSLNISEDLNFDIENFYNLRHIYTGAVFFRNYISLGNSKRFALFNEVRLSAGGGQGKTISGVEEELKGSYQDILEIELGLIPGVTAFIAESVAVEASINVLGFSYKKYDQTRNQVYQGSFESSGVNFKVDILSINIGVSFYFDRLFGNSKKKKN